MYRTLFFGEKLRSNPMTNKFGVLVLLLLATQEECSGEMRLLQIVFSSGHHHHSPTRTPPRPPHRNNFWQTTPGRLTMLGMIHLFRLGQNMRRRYDDFEPEQQDEVDLYASERAAPCSSLKQCFISGFYRPNKNQPPQGETSWHPQNILPPDAEKPADSDLKCPNLQEAASRLYHDTDEGNMLIEQYANLYEYWSANSGMEIRNPTDARKLYENLQLERNFNTSLPPWAERFWPELKRQSDIHFAWLAKNPHMQRLAAGPLLGLMIQRMQRHINGYDIKKYFVYSGKNSSLAGLLAIFGAFDGKEPSFGSTIVLELHRFGAVYYVRIMYFYSTDSHEAPEIITLPGCSEYCPFDQFRLLTTGMVPVRWEQECGLWKSGSSSATMFYAVGLLWLILIFMYN